MRSRPPLTRSSALARRRAPARTLGLAAGLALALLLTTTGEAMPKGRSVLVGVWEKATTSPCSQAYPDRVEFHENGLCFGSKDPPGTFTIWDAGSFDVVGDAEVRISTANDAVVVYGFDLSGDAVTFVDPQRCRFTYRRALSR
jgi:hypothetical protein